MTEALILTIVSGIFNLAQAGVERSAIIDRLQGVPPEKYPDILDSMFAESQQKRNQAISEAPE